METPWTVNECGRRGAMGAGRELFALVDCLVVVACPTEILASCPRCPTAISVLASGLPEVRRLRHGPHRALILRNGVGVYHRAAFRADPLAPSRRMRWRGSARAC